MIDAIEELVARSKDDPELRKFHEFHRRHPGVLDFLVEEIQLRIKRGFRAFSFNSLWNYARWQMAGAETFFMNDHLVPFYARVIIVLHPEFNGRCEFRPSVADAIFGTKIASRKDPSDYASRLEWADGVPIEGGWRPSTAHVITHSVNRKPSVHGRYEK